MKLKKILASLTAAALAITTMAFAPIVSAAENAWSDLPGGVAQIDVTVAAGYKYVFNPSADLTAEEIARVSKLKVSVSTDDFAKYKLGYNGVGGNWTQEADYVEISGGSKTTVHEFTIDNCNYAQLGFDWINPGHTEITALQYLDSSENVVKDMTLPDAEKIKPTADVSLGTTSGGGEQTTIVASWDANSVDQNTWKSDFYSKVKSAASGAYYTNALEYLAEFSGILFEVNVSSVQTVKYGDMKVQPYGSCANYTWISGTTSSVIENGTDKYYVYMDMDYLLGKVAETGSTLAQLGIQIYDEVNFATVGLTGNISYTAGATLLMNAPSLSIPEALSLTVEEEDTIAVTASPAAIASTVKWSSDNEAVATVDGNGKVTAVSAGTAVITASSTAADSLSDTCTVTVAEKEPDKFDIIIAETENGTVAVKGGITSAAKDTVIELIITPDEGYKLDVLTVDDEAIEGTSFVMPEKNVTVKATFKKADYKVTVTVTEGGSAKADKETAQMGDTVSIIDIEPDTGFSLGNITVNGKTIEGTSFVMPAKDVEVEVIFVSEEGFKTVSDFVDRLYTIILGKSADADTLAELTNKLISRNATAAEIVYSIINSSEFDSLDLSDEEAIERLYKAMLGRASDAEGKQNWIDKLADGLSLKGIANGFLDSQEFKQICSDYGIKAGSITEGEPRDKNYGLTSFVSRMYSKALGRAYDVDGINDWTNRYLTGTATASDIAYGFIFSKEFLEKNLSDEDYVETLYEAFFDRSSDAAGKADWLDRMHTQGYSREQVLDGFLGSDEFEALKEGFGV